MGANMKTAIKSSLTVLILLLIAGFASLVYSHCQVPCGIYGDPARFDMIAEHITTIEKSMNQIIELSSEENPDYNQIIRWTNNKDEHADKLSHIVTYYFLAQRLKPVDQSKSTEYRSYIKKLKILHMMIVYSMKTKQSTDIENAEKLKDLLVDFYDEYFGK
jgi:nickel superoxide dismutase